jgi:hypothetical protein
MTFAAVTLLGMTVGQPLGADYHAMNSRTIKLPVEYKQDRKSIRHVLLYVARNGENTWAQEAFITPDKDAFVYVAKDDGVYWFKMVIVDVKGKNDPADLTSGPPDLKMVIDTAPPAVRVTNARRTGDEVVVEWAVEDKFPNDAETKVHFRATDNPNGFWQEVTLPANSRTGVKFPCGTPAGITVKITAADVAGNRTEITRDFPTGTTTTALSPAAAAVVPPVIAPAAAAVAPPAPATPPPTADLVPVSAAPVAPSAPLTPAAPPAGSGLPFNPSVAPPAGTPVAPPAATPVSPAPNPPAVAPQPPTFPTPVYQPSAPSAGGPQPLATIDPKAVPAAPAPTTGATAQAGAWTGTAEKPAAETPRAQVINYPRFNLSYDLEARGPSGISRVDLWVTRDDGRTWQKWSQHEGKGGAVTVALDVRENTQLEGLYGFRLVPVSGAGLSEREPVAGDAPDMRVILDITPPTIDLFAPQSDPNVPDTLIVQWKATDKNFGEDPITLEWAESPAGPWKPVASAGGADPVIQATAVNIPVARRLANTGQYSWRIPSGVPARVYLKASARDAAGNVKEVVTRDPILVDLTKPKAKINSILPPVAPRP